MGKQPVYKAIEKLLGIEGGYVDHVSDSGGKTRWGITEPIARKYGYQGAMSDLPRDIAVQIYKTAYWSPVNLDEIVEDDADLAFEIFEQMVLMGPDQGMGKSPARSVRWLQEWLNVYNKKGQIYGDIVEDGLMGPKTMSAYRKYKEYRGQEGLVVLRESLNCDQGSFLKRLARRRVKDEAFAYGWIKKRIAGL